MVDGELTPEDAVLAARIAARYSQGRAADAVTVRLNRPGTIAEELRVAPLPPMELPPAWHVGG